MSYRGHVKNGVIVLDGNACLPEGVQVVVDPIAADHPNVNQPLTLLERMKPLVGLAKGLPPDLAENHDHYIHGTPKRS